MWTTTTRGKKCGAALLAFSLLLAGAGCAHKELLAPCSDYKAATFSPAARPGTIPCDDAQQMHRPPWVTTTQKAGEDATQEG